MAPLFFTSSYYPSLLITQQIVLALQINTFDTYFPLPSSSSISRYDLCSQMGVEVADASL